MQVLLRVAGEFWGGTDQTERLVTDLRLGDAVELRPGYVDASDVPALFTDVDALVLPYRAGTASFTAYLAFEHERPVIATRVGTAALDVRDGVDGLLCEPDDPDSLADAITRFYADGMPMKLRAGISPVDPRPRWDAYVSALLRAGGLET
jgi:glycosyltransferase involved in cell wall biosynthesis